MTRQQTLWAPPRRDPLRDPAPGDSMERLLPDEQGTLAPHTVRVLEVIRSPKGPKVRVAVLDRQLRETTETLTAWQWWDSLGFPVPELVWQEAGEGWTLFAEGRSAFVRTMGEAAAFLWSEPCT